MTDDPQHDRQLAAVAAAVPPAVRRVCAELEAAGHQAVTVGGAVRDALLGRAAGDWDVASSASPEEVMALFRRTVPTGIAHGTVTVLTGAREVDHVEVTTYRGDGAYSDGRRPDTVHFGVPLEEDLARRDLVVNAMAYSPTQHRLIDPFGGRDDLARRRLRAVGVPLERFREDGLRVMRAIRFAAALEFALDAETEDAIVAALPSLAKVSRERITVELLKLLAAPRPSLGLAIAFRQQVMAQILPEVTAGLEAWGRTPREVCARVDAAEGSARLGALVFDVAGPPGDSSAAGEPRGYRRAAQREAEAMLRRLKMKVSDCEIASQAAAAAGAVALTPALDEAELRAVLAAAGRRHAEAIVACWRADGVARASSGGAALAAAGAQILARGDALAVGELAVTGGDLMKELGLAPGAQLGAILRELLAHVLAHPGDNQRDALLARARRAAAPR
ncbi:MAG: hypothetical protein R3B48_02820 [Kofleriaceae bacterium]